MAAGAIQLAQVLEPMVMELVPMIAGLFKKHAPNAPPELVHEAAVAVAANTVGAMAHAVGVDPPPMEVIEGAVANVLANPPEPAVTISASTVDELVAQGVKEALAAMPAPEPVAAAAPRSTGVIFHGSSAKPDFS
jgi:hypothetical protein